VQALQLELEPYLDSLQFLSEVQLTSEPLRIDVVIIKKSPSLPIKKNIARLLREVNIFEYKSPQDRISIHDFHKTLAYAFLYASLHRVDISGMTVSIIGSRHPRKLFKELREKGYGVEEQERGIYEVEGYPLAVQIIESGRLGMGNLWLTGLRPGLKRETIGEILKETERRDQENLGAYLHAVLGSNLLAAKEVLKMGKKKLTLEDVLEECGYAVEWEQRGEVRGEAQGEKNAWGKAISLLKQGYTVEQLEQMDPVNAPAPVNS
ncbi:MAG: hypothetical protein LBL56_02025, partial [Treponema sp.]|nr:hypothetical protein [Treponema sp.]